MFCAQLCVCVWHEGIHLTAEGTREDTLGVTGAESCRRTATPFAQKSFVLQAASEKL